MSFSDDQNADNHCNLYLFGSFQLGLGGRPIHLPTHKTELLLAYLVLNPSPQSREKLATLFWGDSSDEQARGSLRKAIALLRKSLGHEVLISDRDFVEINPAYSIWVDVLDFQDKANQFLAESSSNPEAMDIDLYRDDLLVDCFDDWITPQRDRLRDLYLMTLFHIVQQYKARGEFEQAILFANRILARDPINEDAHQSLMLSYWSSGNRPAALKQFAECERILREEIGVEPSPKTVALYQRIKQEVARNAQTPSLNNLPFPLTSFIGREKEILQIQRLIAGSRLITLTGSGGCGKTRLAIQVARGLMDAFPDGVWWVELASLTDETTVPYTVAKAAGVRETPNQAILDLLIKTFRSQKILLVLDNCEHLIHACSWLADQLLAHCPNLRILATSREAMNIAGEIAWTVPSLRTPDRKRHLEVAELMDFESVRLFVERARMFFPKFNINEQNAAAISEICQQLDGIPLALELASGRVKTLTPEQIVDRLNDRFGLLNTGSRMALPRHQTLRAVIDWSYGLLNEPEKRLIRWVSIFPGGFTLETVEFLMARMEGDERKDAALDQLDALVNKSLVFVEEDLQESQNRYYCQETVRQYAFEKLQAAGETEPARNIHLDYYSKKLDQASRELQSPAWMRWIGWFEREMDNLRAMQEWALAHDPLRALEIGGTSAFMRFWGRSGYGTEATRWLQAALNRVELLPDNDRNESPELSTRRKKAMALGLTSLGLITTGLGNYEKSLAILKSGLELWRELGDQNGLVICLGMMSHQALFTGNPEHARQYAEECLEIANQLKDDLAVGEALVTIGLYKIRHEKDAENGKACLEESILRMRGYENHLLAGIPILFLGTFLSEQGDRTRSRVLLEEANRIFSLNGDRLFLNITRSGLADIARLERNYSLAETLYYQTALEWNVIGNPGALARCLECLAFIADERSKEQVDEKNTGDVHQIGVLLGAAEQLRKGNNAPMMPHEREDYELRLSALRSQADVRILETAWDVGRALDREGIIVFLKDGSYSK